MAKGITDLLKGGSKGVVMWTDEANNAFRKLKTAFITAPILRHFDPALEIRVETDASGFAIVGILSQLFGSASNARWHPVAFYSRKLEEAE